MAAEHLPPESRSGSGVRAARRDGLPDGSLVLDQVFDVGALHLLREAVAAGASAAGLGESRVHDVVVAAHEMAANAVRHGAGNGRLRLRSDGLVLCCQVSDGAAARDGEPGPVAAGAPSWPVEHAHGLWLIGQVADQFRIDHGPGGTSATACFAIGPARPEAGGGSDAAGREAPTSTRRS